NLAMRSLLLERGAAELDFKSIPKSTKDAIRGMVRWMQLDMVLAHISKMDPAFREEMRKRIAHLKPGFDEAARRTPGEPKQPPFFETDPEQRKYVIQIVKLALERGLS